MRLVIISATAWLSAAQSSAWAYLHTHEAIANGVASDAKPGGVAIRLPSFDYTATLLTPEGGDLLRAEETGTLRIDLRNLELQPFREVRILYKALVSVEGLVPAGAFEVGSLAAGETRLVELPFLAGRNLVSGDVDYVVEVLAEGGAYGPPARVSFRTRAFDPPRFDIVVVEGIPAAGSEMRRLIVVRAQIQNLGGLARDVSARFWATDPGITIASTASSSLGDLANGQVREITAQVDLAPELRRHPDVPLWLEVNERHADLGIRKQVRLRLSVQENGTLTNSTAPPAP